MYIVPLKSTIEFYSDKELPYTGEGYYNFIDCDI